MLPSSEAKFGADRDTQDIVIRRLEIIGEATRHLPEELKQKYPEAGWGQLRDLRNFLIHEYFRVDIGLVWNNVNNYLPILKRITIEIINESSKDE